MGHLWRSPQRSEVCLWKIRCCPDVLRHWKSGQPRQLQGDVVQPDKEILPQHSRDPGRVQERRALHLQGRAIPQILPRSQSSCKVKNLTIPPFAGHEWQKKLFSFHTLSIHPRAKACFFKQRTGLDIEKIFWSYDRN